ncbi:MAG: tRNA adenosine deaminase-associated protein [Nocardioides sp.]
MVPTGAEMSNGVSVPDFDFAVAAYREEGVWQLQEVTSESLASAGVLADALRRLPGDGGALGLVAMDEDFFVLIRVAGPLTRMLLSDVTAAEEFEFARSVLEFLGVASLDEDDQAPAGDLDLLGDIGMPAMDLGLLIDDLDLYPDEMLSAVAGRLGFGPQFDDVVGVSTPPVP